MRATPSRARVWAAMPSRPVRVAVAASFALSAVIAFLLFQAVDNALPVSTRSALSITEISGNTTDEQVLSTLERGAEELNLMVTKVVPDLERPERLRSLFVFNRPASAPQGGPQGADRAFSPTMQTQVYSGTEMLGRDLRGLYAIDADADQAVALADSLVKIGATAQIEPIDIASILHHATSDMALIPVALAFAVCLLLVIAYAAASSRKEQVLWQLHGLGELRILANELLGLALYCVTACCVILACTAAVLSFLNGLSGFGEFLVWVTTSMGVALGIVLVLHLLAFVFTPSLDSMPVLSGRRPVAFVVLTSMVAYVTCFVIVVAAGVSVSALVEQGKSEASASSYWVAARDLGAVRMSHTLVTSDQEELERRFGVFYARAEINHGTLLAYGGAKQVSSIADPRERFAPYSGNSLIVNPRFLQRIAIVDNGGARVTESVLSPTDVTLLIPESHAADASEIMDLYRDFAVFEQSLRHDSQGVDMPRVGMKLLQDGQQVFTFADGALADSILDSPVIAVIPFEAHVLSDSFYLAATSTQNVLFQDRSGVDALVKSEAIDDLVSSAYSVADRASLTRLELAQRLTSHVIGIVLCASALGAAGVAIATTYAHAARRRFAVRVINGWGATRANSEFHLLHAAVIVTTLAGMFATGMLTVDAWAIALGAAMSVWGVAFVALRVFQRAAATSLATR